MVGVPVGADDWYGVGVAVEGVCVGASVGACDGVPVVGTCVGAAVGVVVGATVVGVCEGGVVGATVVGTSVGCRVGALVRTYCSVVSAQQRTPRNASGCTHAVAELLVDRDEPPLTRNPSGHAVESMLDVHTKLESNPQPDSRQTSFRNSRLVHRRAPLLSQYLRASGRVTGPGQSPG